VEVTTLKIVMVVVPTHAAGRDAQPARFSPSGSLLGLYILPKREDFFGLKIMSEKLKTWFDIAVLIAFIFAAYAITGEPL
jgi:hypothetical protein